MSLKRAFKGILETYKSYIGQADGGIRVNKKE